MGLVVSATGDKEYKLCPAGNHLARCYRIIDLGTQKTVWNGVEQAKKQLMITWELHGEDADGNPLLTDDGKPLVISRRFTPSINKKATLRAFLVAWRGRDFTNEELEEFNLRNVIDKWCMVNITHNNKGEKTYANVTSISAVPAALKKAGLPEGINPLVWFDIDEPDMKVYSEFPDYMKELISSSPEWRMREDVGSNSAGKVTSNDEEDEDIPF